MVVYFLLALEARWPCSVPQHPHLGVQVGGTPAHWPSPAAGGQGNRRGSLVNGVVTP